METKTENPTVKIIALTPENIAGYGVCGYKDIKKQVELRRKIEWYSKYYAEGLRIKALIAEPGGYQGMIEYMPGEIAHRPVEAKGFLFIQCVFVGFKTEFKGKGFATLLLKDVINEARESNHLGVAVVTRAGSFMADKDLFLKHGFSVVDKAKPDFELLVLKFDANTVNPSLKSNFENRLKNYKQGLVIMRSPQCPYTEKNVNAILETARRLSLEPQLIELKDAETVQDSPCAFGSFCIIYNGEIIAHHPISNTRFENIIKTKLKTAG
jgi:GNAT superfamily N-acetyltransferase